MGFFIFLIEDMRHFVPAQVLGQSYGYKNKPLQIHLNIE